MTTVSLVECGAAPVSLRACGSSNRSLIENRLRLQSSSPEKLMQRTPPPRSKMPDIRGISMSPACVEGPGLLCTSPAYSIPIKWQYGYRSDDYSGPVTSSDEFSDEDLNEICGSQEVAKMLSHDRYDDLKIIGSKRKLHTLFGIPAVKSPVPKKPIVNEASPPEENLSDLDRDCTSPGNPPPSPVNFLPPLAGFIVGGKKLKCPDKANGARDFVPGFVKYPLYHCKQCAGRVLDEEQSQRRYCSNRRPPSYRSEDSLISSRLSHRNLALQDPIGVRYRESSPHLPTCTHRHRSFVEIYTEKKKLKEEKERNERKNTDNVTKYGGVLNGVYKQKESGDTNLDVSKTSRKCSDYYDKEESKAYIGARISSANDDWQRSPDVPAPKQLQLANFSDLSIIQVAPDVEPKRPVLSRTSVLSDSQSDGIKRSQMRRCSSDIWPFPDNHDTLSPTDPDKMEKIRIINSMENYRTNKERITPHCPLPSRALTSKYSVEQSKSSDSLKTTPTNVLSSTNMVAEDKDIPESSITTTNHSEDDDEETMNADITLTATVIVPSQEKSCTEWISFNTDHEPVLNNTSLFKDDCDNFLKRLQKTKLSLMQDQCTSIPPGQQFCFEPIIDKRYNRWKRRRRKKKDSETHRSTNIAESDSSDDDEVNEREMERIIDHMYEEIHGPPPETPNGSNDTPRLRNRRRRREIAEETQDPLPVSPLGRIVTPRTRHRRHRKEIATEIQTDLPEEMSSTSDVHYDASSEWINSDKSDDDNIFIQSQVHYTNSDKNTVSAVCERNSVHDEAIQDEQCGQLSAKDCTAKTPEEHIHLSPERNLSSPFIEQDGCNWPYIDQYTEALMERVKCNPTDEIRLPDIPISAYALKSPDDLRSITDSKTDQDQDQEVMDPYPKLHESKPDIEIMQRNDTISSSSQIQIKTKEKKEIDILPSPVKESITATRLARKPIQPIKPRTLDDRPNSLSHINAAKWSGIDYKLPRPIGVVSKGGMPVPRLPVASPTFNVALRPVRSIESGKLDRKTSKIGLGRAETQKKKEQTLPRQIKNPRTQMTPSIRLQNSCLKNDKKLKKIRNDVAQRPKTIPQTKKATQTNANSSGHESHSDLLLREYYLRNIFGNKTRTNSHMNSLTRATRLKQTITVDRLDLGIRKLTKKPEEKEDERVSNLSFTRAFTYSMFDLPDVYKMYNKRIERKASQDLIGGSLV